VSSAVALPVEVRSSATMSPPRESMAHALTLVECSPLPSAIC
jgi:hypothetical protein